MRQFEQIQIAQSTEDLAGEDIDLIVGQIQVGQPCHIRKESFVQSADVVVVQEETLTQRQIAECIAVHFKDLIVLQIEFTQTYVIGEGILIEGHNVIVVQNDALEEGQIGKGIALDDLHLGVLDDNAAQVLQRLNDHGGYVVQACIVLDDELEFAQTLLLIETRPGGIILMQALREHPALGLLHGHVILVRRAVAHELHITSAHTKAGGIDGPVVARDACQGAAATAAAAIGRVASIVAAIIAAGHGRCGSGGAYIAVTSTIAASLLLIPRTCASGRHEATAQEQQQAQQLPHSVALMMMRQHCESRPRILRSWLK